MFHMIYISLFCRIILCSDAVVFVRVGCGEFGLVCLMFIYFINQHVVYY